MSAAITVKKTLKAPHFHLDDLWLCSLDLGQTGGAPEEGRKGETELTREVQRLVRSGINSDRIVPSIVSSWPDLTGREREFVAEVLDAQAGRSQPNPAKGRELLARWRGSASGKS